MNRIPLTFLHPSNSSDRYEMAVAPEATARQTVLQLIKGDHEGPWLDPEPPGRPYELVLNRTAQVIPANVTLGGAGTVGGDVIAVMQPGQGADSGGPLASMRN
jgi:hypothetical protein